MVAGSLPHMRFARALTIAVGKRVSFFERERISATEIVRAHAIQKTNRVSGMRECEPADTRSR